MKAFTEKRTRSFFPGKHSIGSSPAVKQVVNKCKQWLLSPRQCSNVTGRLQPALCTGAVLQFPTGWASLFSAGARYKIRDTSVGHKQPAPLTVPHKKQGEGLVTLGAASCLPVPTNLGVIASKITSRYDSTCRCQTSTWCKSTQTQ